MYVIDDDEAVRDSISMLLDTENIEHTMFASAIDFLDAYDDSMCGCLVLDIRMPGMTGLELQEALNRRHPSLPIIFITGHGDIPMAVEAMRRGAVDFLRKPFGEDDLLQRVNEALAQAATEGAKSATRSDGVHNTSIRCRRAKEKCSSESPPARQTNSSQSNSASANALSRSIARRS